MYFSLPIRRRLPLLWVRDTISWGSWIAEEFQHQEMERSGVRKITSSTFLSECSVVDRHLLSRGWEMAFLRVVEIWPFLKRWVQDNCQAGQSFLRLREWCPDIKDTLRGPRDGRELESEGEPSEGLACDATPSCALRALSIPGVHWNYPEQFRDSRAGWIQAWS